MSDLTERKGDNNPDHPFFVPSFLGDDQIWLDSEES